MNKEYDLYKVYGLTKLLQEKEQLQEQLLKEIFKEINVNFDEWCANFEIHYNDKKISIEDVKEQCDILIEKEEEYNKKNKND